MDEEGLEKTKKLSQQQEEHQQSAVATILQRVPEHHSHHDPQEYQQQTEARKIMQLDNIMVDNTSNVGIFSDTTSIGSHENINQGLIGEGLAQCKGGGHSQQPSEQSFTHPSGYMQGCTRRSVFLFVQTALPFHLAFLNLRSMWLRAIQR